MDPQPIETATTIPTPPITHSTTTQPTTPATPQHTIAPSSARPPQRRAATKALQSFSRLSTLFGPHPDEPDHISPTTKPLDVRGGDGLHASAGRMALRDIDSDSEDDLFVDDGDGEGERTLKKEKGALRKRMLVKKRRVRRGKGDKGGGKRVKGCGVGGEMGGRSAGDGEVDGDGGGVVGTEGIITAECGDETTNSVVCKCISPSW